MNSHNLKAPPKGNLQDQMVLLGEATKCLREAADSVLSSRKYKTKGTFRSGFYEARMTKDTKTKQR